MDDVLFVMRIGKSAQIHRYLRLNNLLQLSHLIEIYYRHECQHIETDLLTDELSYSFCWTKIDNLQ